MAKLHCCIKCNMSFASYQSLWNHKQRCSKPKKSESDDKEKIIGDILNKVDQRVKDRAPIKVDDAGPIEEKTNESEFNLESDSVENE